MRLLMMVRMMSKRIPLIILPVVEVPAYHDVLVRNERRDGVTHSAGDEGPGLDPRPASFVQSYFLMPCTPCLAPGFA